MNHAVDGQKRTVSGFRIKLFAVLMLIVAGLVAIGLIVGQRNITANVERDLQRDFQAQLTALHKLQELRDSALAERCRILSDKPRIHAALEDNALDLLYASAKDELRDLMQPNATDVDQPVSSLHATFYRFLDSSGAVLPPTNVKNVGELNPSGEAQLNLKKLPDKQQTGFVVEDPHDARVAFHQVIALPIFSTETGELISALVVGFKPFELTGKGAAGMKSGIWSGGILHFPHLSEAGRRALSERIARAVSKGSNDGNNFITSVDGTQQLLFFKQLNPDSIFAPAYEICVYPLAESISQLHRLRWKIGTAGVFLLLGGFVVSQFAVAHLSRPVEQLAVDSQQNRAEREKAEAALETATEELERSSRYSADASHQLKSPVTILRTGLEQLLQREDFTPEIYEELSAMLHQTRRLTDVIDDLLLLARMDAGHLKIRSQRVNLSLLIEQWLDDLSALSETPEIQIEKQVPQALYICGEREYLSLIVQNLLENAWKYNRPNGVLRITVGEKDGEVVLTIGNTGRTIPTSEHEHIFERFYRDAGGTSIIGHGLGLSLARELARLHGGDLRLVRSANDWTAFDLRLPVANGFPGEESCVA